MAEVLNEVGGMSWFQILPVGQKSSQPYQFNCIHVLPDSKAPVAKLPLDTLIGNQVAYIKRADNRASQD
jgi:hypothetical protein